MAKILVVDDSTAVRDFLTTILVYSGYDVEEAVDGAEALERARAARPDLIICDLVMPRMDGYAFLERLRSEPPLETTPVIFFTASYELESARALAGKCGWCEILLKPSNSGVILACVERMLRDAPSPAAVPEDFGPHHLRLLTDTLSQKVNQLEELGAELVEARMTARAVQRARDELVSRIFRSLRKPLDQILARARRLAACQTTPESIRHDLSEICRGVEAQIRILDELLETTGVMTDDRNGRRAPASLPGRSGGRQEATPVAASSSSRAASGRSTSNETPARPLHAEDSRCGAACCT